MPLPNSADLLTMDFAFQGQPFVHVPAKSTIDTTTMDIAYLAQPFVTNPDDAAGETITLDKWFGSITPSYPYKNEVVGY